MITLVIDTETTGFPLKDVPASDPRQARIMQLGAILLDDEKEVACFYSRLYPDDWPPVNPGAEAAHGITLDSCKRLGLAQKVALNAVDEMSAVADIVVAHNYKFDAQMLTIEYELQGSNFQPKASACTMELMTNICGLTKSNGSPKWPKLEEALAKIGEDHSNAHDALSDVRGTAKLWQWLVANGIYK